MYIDAGLMSNNLSWEYFSKIPSKNKLGIYICIEDEKSYINSNISLKNYIIQILKTYIIQSISLYEKTINLNDENILLIKEDLNTFDTSIKLTIPTDEKIREMLKDGYNDMQVYLKKKL